MIFLFGSYARGDWVEDVPNGYFSDYDLLVIVATEEQATDVTLWSNVSDQARAIAGRTPVTLLVHDFKQIAKELRVGQYFFSESALRS